MSETEKEPVAPAKKQSPIEVIDEKIAAFAAQLEALEAGLPALVAEHVEKVAGPILGKYAEELAGLVTTKLEELTAAGEHEAEGLVGEGADELKRFVEHVNAKVHAIHNALQRAIGIEVPLPLLEDPADKAIGEITVAGAEVAQT